MSNGKRRKSGPGKGTKDDKAQRPDGPSPEGGANLETPQNTAEGGSAASTDTSSPQMARRTGIPVVGMGGSAGALDCFKAFFEAMPPDSGAAFVVIQHLAPGHVSMLPELLAQHTRMTVAQAQDGAEVEPNCVYIIPPNEYLDIRGGVLHLSEPVKQDGIRMPIDFFFRHLAEDQKDKAVCILLSGMGEASQLEENLRVGAFSRAHSKDVKADLNMVYQYFPRLEDLKKSIAGYLSGGEQQMLVIGRAMMAAPKLMMLDEPSLGLAPMVVQQIYEIIQRFNVERGTSILLVEQNVRVALDTAHYGYVMENGRVVLDGSADYLKGREDVKEFYMGISASGAKKSFKDIKHYKRRKRWL